MYLCSSNTGEKCFQKTFCLKICSLFCFKDNIMMYKNLSLESDKNWLIFTAIIQIANIVNYSHLFEGNNLK